jgi:hypothetical protein
MLPHHAVPSCPCRVWLRQLWIVPVVNPDGYIANCDISDRTDRMIRYWTALLVQCVRGSGVAQGSQRA